MKKCVAHKIYRFADMLEVEKPIEAPKKVFRPREDKITPTAKPNIKPSRKQTEVSKKFNEDNKSEYMQEYMEKYREEGKDIEAPGVHSKYVKKPKM